MLVIGCVMGNLSERRLCQEVHLNLAYRWFCRLGSGDKVPDHSTLSRYRHGTFGECGLPRRIFEATAERCLKEGPVSGDAFAVDTGLIPADANKVRSIGTEEGRPYFAHATNHLIDTRSSVIMDVEATRAIRQAGVGASRTMLDRTEKRFGIRPDWLAAETAYDNGENLGRLVEKGSIIPFIPLIDKSERTDGTFSRPDFE